MYKKYIRFTIRTACAGKRKNVNDTTWHTNKIRTFPVRDLHENNNIILFICIVVVDRITRTGR